MNRTNQLIVSAWDDLAQELTAGSLPRNLFVRQVNCARRVFGSNNGRTSTPGQETILLVLTGSVCLYPRLF